MPSLVARLVEKGLTNPPHWMANNIAYETIMGSNAYGVTSDNSDLDVYGFVIPPKHIIFPHLAGAILLPRNKSEGGYGIFGGDDVEIFRQFQHHHIWDEHAAAGKGTEYDLNIFNIVKYFHLLMDNNPNMVDSLFTPHECILHCTEVGNMVREKRTLFLHKGLWERFKGYAYSQMHKMNTKLPGENSKRKEIREKFGFDVKYASHLVRLLDECEQLLMYGDMDMRRNKEQLKAIRRGEVPEKDIRRWAAEKEKQLEKTYSETKLPDPPKHNPKLRKEIKQLLIDCLEHHYGNLEGCVSQPDKAEQILSEIRRLVN